MKSLIQFAMMLAIVVSMAFFSSCGGSSSPIDPPDPPPPPPPVYAPTIGTAEASGITTTSVEVKGTVSNNGGAVITEQGAILDSDKKTAVISVTEFTVSYTNLKANTSYIAKVFATNSKGTSYKEVTFKTLEIIIPPVGGKIKDYDGNEYDTVRIGNQTWTVQNLKVMHYNDGTDIPLVSDNAAWTSQAIGSMCYRSNVVSSKDTYGMLYNFYTTINPRGICPAGWRVPTLDDFIVLVKYFGNGDYNAGKRLANGKLKSTSLLWHQPNVAATNSSGFSALPGGARGSDGVFHPFMDYCTGFWSSTQFLPSGFCGRLTISGDVEEVDAGSSDWSHPRIAFSIRLIKIK